MMDRTELTIDKMMENTPSSIKLEVDMESAISNRIAELMKENGSSKASLAHDLGKRPSEITKWISGQHNFSLRTISLLSAYFGKPIIEVHYVKE